MSSAYSENESGEVGAAIAMLEELRSHLQRQWNGIDSLDTKAIAALGAGSLSISVLTTVLVQVGLPSALAPVLFYGCVGLLYGLGVVSTVVAIWVRKWDFPIQVERDHIKADYLSLNRADLLWQLLLQYTEAIGKNEPRIEAKAKWASAAIVLFSLSLLILLLAVAGSVVSGGG
jgi:hypothetical protein